MDTVAMETDPVDEAIGSVMGTMHGVSGGEGQQWLGPTIWTQVYFEGSPVEALVDTSSPATIVRLRFVLEVLAAQRDPGQSPPELASYVRSRMQQPTTTLQNYGRGKLNIVRQMPAKLSKGDKQLRMVVYIQDGAPVDLLLGTDVLPFLGFCLQEQTGGPPHNLLGSGGVGEKQDLDGGCAKGPVSTQPNTTQDYTITDDPNSSTSTRTVRFLHPGRMPPHHAKLAMVNLEGMDQYFLLEPIESLLADKGIQVEPGVAQTDEDGRFTLVLQNYTGESVYLEEGEVICHTQAAQIKQSVPFPVEEKTAKCVEAATGQSLWRGYHSHTCRWRRGNSYTLVSSYIPVSRSMLICFEGFSAGSGMRRGSSLIPA